MNTNLNVDLNALLDFDLPTYYIDSSLVAVNCNDAHAQVIGLQNRKDYQGLTVFDMCIGEKQPDLVPYAHSVMSRVMRLLKSESHLYTLSDLNGQPKTILTTYCPLYNAKAVLGIYGFVQVISGPGAHGVKNIISSDGLPLLQLQITNSPDNAFQHPLLRQLTEQQTICLKYLLSGKRVKDIASLICRSPRTVESHLNHIKLILDVKTLNQLIEKCHHNGIVQILNL